jgi:lysyl-tRNA synthetase, class II
MKDIREQRIETRLKLKENGVNPYGGKFSRTFNIKQIIENYKQEIEVVVSGRVMNVRKHGKTMFLDLKDFSGKVQLYIKKDDTDKEKQLLIDSLDIGDILGVKGRLFKSRTEEITIMVDDFNILSKSLRPLPEKWHGLKDVETRYRQRYLDLIVNDDVKDCFIKRTQIIKQIRKFLDDKDFLEVETPMMQSVAGGAAAKPFVTHHNSLDMDLYLRIAPELYLKRLIVGGFEKIYEINRNFRNEGISPTHNPEFTMLEIYSAYDDYKDMMDLCESLISCLVENIIKTNKVEIHGKEIDFSLPWQKKTMLEIVKEHTDIDFNNCDIKEVAKKFKIENADKINKEEIMNIVFEEAVEDKLINPTFIIDYPAILCPLSKTKEQNSDIAERFELFIGGKEIANAYSELNDPIEQRERFLEQAEVRGEDEKYSLDEDFVRALEYGMPPAGGLGIGIDRLVMMLTGAENIRDVIFFPQLRKES